VLSKLLKRRDSQTDSNLLNEAQAVIEEISAAIEFVRLLSTSGGADYVTISLSVLKKM
jgi:hypothetical protein